ncbi:MAG TPA: thioredoxin-dependent thiol peroxidase [Candidatus Marinimicrobia bacterium]|nr:thioredoxin-dependent thiol peroxidase [Candidatus Neomarinimicrobiota bacterium]
MSEIKLTAGDLAPDFTLSGPAGKTHSLSGYRGKKVVVYFYPKDDTPGCTKEACGFRDAFSEYEKQGIVILGISPDKANAHEKFINKYNLPFPLLSDPDKEVIKSYGAWGTKNMYGKITEGVIRKTFLLDENGIIVKAYHRVKVDEHAAKILADFGF